MFRLIKYFIIMYHIWKTCYTKSILLLLLLSLFIKNICVYMEAAIQILLYYYVFIILIIQFLILFTNGEIHGKS